MAFVNANYLKLKAGYLFPEIARRVNQFLQAHPDAPLIRLGIGDVTEPLPAACRQAMIQAVEEMGDRATFKGYGLSRGILGYGKKLPPTTSKPAAATLMPVKFLFPTAPSATQGISSIFLATATALPLPTPFIPSMWIPMSWQGTRGKPMNAGSTLDWSICRLPLKTTSPPRYPVNLWT